MTTTTSTTTKRFVVEQVGTMSYIIVDVTTEMHVTNRFGYTRYFSSAASARKAVTRLSRPVGDRHR